MALGARLWVLLCRIGRWLWNWWKPLSRLRKALVLLVLLSPLAYHYYRKSREQPFEFSIEQHRPGAVPYDVYLVDALEVQQQQRIPPEDHLRLSKASLSRPFGVVVRFYHLVPGRAYQVVCDVEDDDGVKILGDAPRNIQSATAEGTAYFPFIPDREKHAAGDWTARVSVSGIGVIEYEFEVDGLTGEQKDSLADHEEAREQVKKAFAHFWVVAAHQKQKTFVTATGERETEDLFKRYKLYQVAGLEYNSQQQYVTPADRLNGISYLGTIGFGFTLYRSYDPDTGWGEWKDVDRPENILHYGWNRLSGQEYGDPERRQQAPSMRFKIECRDGNWIVTTQEGARFINGSRKDDDKATAAAAEARKKNNRSYDDRDQLFTGETFQPRMDFVAKISDEGTTLRGEILRLAKEVAASPETVKEQQEITVKMIPD